MPESDTHTPRRQGRGGARSLARKLALQGLYQRIMTGQPAADIFEQLAAGDEFRRAEGDYLKELLLQIERDNEDLDALLDEYSDRPVVQLDPIEHAVLLIGLYELRSRADVPCRVALNEAVELARRFGGTDGHRFVNAVLDRAARVLRVSEL